MPTEREREISRQLDEAADYLEGTFYDLRMRLTVEGNVDSFSVETETPPLLSGLTNADILAAATRITEQVLRTAEPLQIEFSTADIDRLMESFGHELALALKHVMGLNMDGKPSRGEWLGQ